MSSLDVRRLLATTNDKGQAILVEHPLGNVVAYEDYDRDTKALRGACERLVAVVKSGKWLELGTGHLVRPGSVAPKFYRLELTPAEYEQALAAADKVLKGGK